MNIGQFCRDTVKITANVIRFSLFNVEQLHDGSTYISPRHFHQIGPLCRFDLVVAMSVCPLFMH